MAQWTVSWAPERCGQGCDIPAGAPMQLLVGGRQRRCVAHAIGPVDVIAIDAARERLKQEQHDDLIHRLRGEKRTTRPYRHPRPVRPAAARQPGLYDPRARAANDHKD